MQLLLNEKISIHASMKEATLGYHDVLKTKDDFNPRLHEGGDKSLPVIIKAPLDISIHASMKEATLPSIFNLHFD